MLSLISLNVYSQGIRITGTVSDAETGETVPGVSVVVEGTTSGTVTDIDGAYTLNIDNGDVTLLYSFIGYLTSKEVVGNRSVIDVALGISVTELEEIVVVGYGTQKKRVVTGAIASVSAAQIEALPITRVEQALQGQTAGVQVTNLSGQPGEAPTVKIRGTGTTGNASPLYIVDGMALEGIDYLNPSDIESIDVLKDAASAAIYGARAANGVVLITTKSAKDGKLNLTYSGYVGFQNVGKTIDMLNASEYKMIRNEGASNASATATLPFNTNEISAHDTDWQSEIFEKNAPMSNHNIQVSGGNGKSGYAASISKFSQQGIIGGKKSQFERFTASLKSTHKMDKFTFGQNINYSNITRRGIDSNTAFNGAYNGALNLDPLTPVYETDADLLNQSPYLDNPVITSDDGRVYGISNIFNSDEVVNPLALIQNQNAETRVDKVVGNVYGEVEPIEGLKFRSAYSLELAYVLDDSYRPLFYLNGQQNNLRQNATQVNKKIDRYFKWQWENTVTYSKKVGDHNIGGLLGVSAREELFENIDGSKNNIDLSNPDFAYLNLALGDTVSTGSISGGANESALYSIFGRLTYDYKEKYSLTAIMRRDGSSRFGANNKFGIFPSLGVAWIISDESFMPNLGPVNILKLRGSWGINGNDKIGNYPFAAPILVNAAGYSFPSGTAVGASPDYIENPDIRWEESEQLDIALDFGLYENRLTGSIDYYKKTTNGLLEIIDVPGHIGNDAPTVNAGGVENKGFEFVVNWRNSIGELNYSVGVNGAFNKNTITDIKNPAGFISGASSGLLGSVTRSEVGQPIAYFWGFQTDGLFQTQAEVFQHIGPEGDVLQPNAVPGDVKFIDINGDGVIGDGDQTKIGDPTPDMTFGINANANYKGFDFSMLFTGSVGNDIYNSAFRKDLTKANKPTSILGRWTGEGTSNSIPRLDDSNRNGNNRNSDLYVENGSFVKLRNAQIGYTLPGSILDKIGATSWRFYLSAENLFVITSYSGADPEIGAISSFDIGVDRAIYPQARTIRVGTSISF